jgi:RNA polymerase sigma factor (sigma-70 family)
MYAMTTVHLPVPAVSHQAAGTDAILNSLSASQRALVEEALRTPLSYIDNDLFAQPQAAHELVAQGLAIAPAAVGWYHPTLETARYDPATCRPTLLTPEQEKHFFLRYNYARRRTQLAVARFRARPSRVRAREIAQWYGQSKDLCDLIARANLALVLAMARQTRIRDMENSELVSEGNLALLRAVAAFDVSRGVKFASYACRVILRSFSRLAARTRRYRATFPTEFVPAMERSDYSDTRHAEREEDTLEGLRGVLRANRAGLSAIERTVIQTRFAIDGGTSATELTLEAVGRSIGLSKERVRQIQNQALPKLRASIEQYI